MQQPSPLRRSESGWTTSPIVNSRMDLVPARKPSDLQVILRTRDHAAYFDPESKQLSLLQTAPNAEKKLNAPEPNLSADAASARPLVPLRKQHGYAGPPVCPTCSRPWPLSSSDTEAQDGGISDSIPILERNEVPSFVAPNYFRLLAEASSIPGSNFNTRPSTPNLGGRNRFESESGSSTPDVSSSRKSRGRSGASSPEPTDHDYGAEGYYARFFVEIKRLGRGARGQVYLCQHVLNGNKLGKYAIKKIPVGDQAQTLLQSLNEVHLMESLHHPHLIHYQHAWIERCQLSPFSPQVPTLFVLMMAANGGSLADWISARAGDASNDSPQPSNSSGPSGFAASEARADKGKETVKTAASPAATASPAERRKIERLKAALRQRRALRQGQSLPSSSIPSSTSPAGQGGYQASTGVGVHLLREEEIYSLLHDMASGLGFLHDRGILHLDIKPGNVLLHWDEDAMIPRAMLSDFGSSLLVHDNWSRTRTGHTGTMEYMSPETVLLDPVTGKLKELSSKADIWSLGMILHLLLFFSLPFPETDDIEQLRALMAVYKGFDQLTSSAVKRAQRTDPVLLALLERMLHVDPQKRPTCVEILHILSSRPARTDVRPANGSDPKRREGISMALYRPSTLPPLSDTSMDGAEARPTARRLLSLQTGLTSDSGDDSGMSYDSQTQDSEVSWLKQHPQASFGLVQSISKFLTCQVLRIKNPSPATLEQVRLMICIFVGLLKWISFSLLSRSVSTPPWAESWARTSPFAKDDTFAASRNTMLSTLCTFFVLLDLAVSVSGPHQVVRRPMLPPSSSNTLLPPQPYRGQVPVQSSDNSDTIADGESNSQTWRGRAQKMPTISVVCWIAHFTLLFVLMTRH